MKKTSPVLLVAVCVACSTRQPASRSDSVVAATAAPSATTTATAGGEVPVSSKESAVAPEINPPGDIPDSQAFVKYTSAAPAYSFEVPEGWARTGNGSSASFVSKLDGVKIDIMPASAAPTAATATSNAAKQIQAQGHAVTITGVTDVTLPAGKAVLIKYDSNSDPNPVTQKQVRLDNQAYLIFSNGQLATLTFWAPKGADNIDQWNRMSRSFRWQ